MANMEQQFFKVFHAGKYPQGEITSADVAEIAASYDPKYHEAPLTLLHDDDSPAYALVDQVRADGKNLFVSFRDVISDAYEANKKYRKPSIEVTDYEGKKYLRAVSLTNFPQVKGLDTIKLSEKQPTIFFSEDLTINLKKGVTMFSEPITKLAEAISINISDYSVDGDVVQKAVEYVNGLKAQLAEATTNVSSLNVSLGKFTEAGVTAESFAEMKTRHDAMMAEVSQYKKDRVDTLVNYALESKDVKPAQTDSLRKLAESDYDNAKKFVEGLPIKKPNEPLGGARPVGKEVTYEEVLSDPNLAANFSEADLADLKKKSKIFR